MINEISIRDLGVIDDAVLPLGAGFTAVTGETGAGKTMVVQALGLVLGARADSGTVRSGSKQASVEGRWIVPATGEIATRVQDAGGDLDPQGDDTAELILLRTVSSEGRSRAVVGGRGAPASLLAELGEHLIVVHGQSDQMRLTSSTEQRSALDRFAGEALSRIAEQYSAVFGQARAARAELASLIDERDERAREAEGLRVALGEIDELGPIEGEDLELAERAEKLTNLEDLRLAAEESRDLVSSEALDSHPDIIGLLDSARRQLERVAPHDAALQPIVESLASAGFLVAEVSTQLSSYIASLDSDGAAELDSIQQRRASLAVLARKYGPELGDVIRFGEAAGPRLLELDNDSDRIEQLRAELDDLDTRATALAAQLTAARTEAAATLSARVTDELAALAMPTARFVIEVTARDELTASGADSIRFLLQPHGGSTPRSLAKGASGGELSRVMLAIEVVLAATDPVPTFVFDEVDAGIGGAAAIEIGRRLALLAKTSQVIVVTHLAQVAAFATNHLTVVKDSSGAVTASSVTQLDGDARAAEMARLLSGLPDSKSGLEHARELLDLAAAG
ncbi:DNA repair protein RecN [Agreia sp. Leaf244]|uniref:DNA repair protein RecN n=1 Tax=Agreia sp. Leaf244 TaxID=1736305 RepID=UPI0006F6AA13|nr:DNA repair protein RecN [Agreia sp. Leaf244]KQO05744.1 DNA repair protein RecN [Agreia sp. Leaf244]